MRIEEHDGCGPKPFLRKSGTIGGHRGSCFSQDWSVAEGPARSSRAGWRGGSHFTSPIPPAAACWLVEMGVGGTMSLAFLGGAHRQLQYKKTPCQYFFTQVPVQLP
ncbi:hypothetical protein GCM10014715_89110 [Streptomyces spiralis]|uniref:Uncharacterized protein n=1 Tax=Streptomyces spiralis TaxID=66376 RepID=A0A919AT70_9ACTN|nr:hypothetical protein GCM10014715_89110 [Streptomyces spiralis]